MEQQLQKRRAVTEQAQFDIRSKIYFNLSFQNRQRKRIFDLLVVFLTLPIVLPLGIITAILIKLDSRGPVFFIQDRVGYKGQVFKMYKFRSMVVNSEVNGSKFAKKKDNRVTFIGKIIRKYRIDELPQFWNVLKGEMSIIGPRPEQVPFVEFFQDEIENYELRHLVKPGITGLAQVNNGYASCKDSTKAKLKYDLFYLRNHSFKLDMVIIFETLKTILTGFGAR